MDVVPLSASGRRNVVASVVVPVMTTSLPSQPILLHSLATSISHSSGVLNRTTPLEEKKKGLEGQLQTLIKLTNDPAKRVRKPE